jgi:hypothetical protein
MKVDTANSQVTEAVWKFQIPAGGYYQGWDLRLLPGFSEDFRESEGLKLRFGSDEEGIWLFEEEEVVKIWSPGFALSWNTRNKQGKAQISTPEEWQNVLRFIYFFEILQCGGLLLHASSVVRNGMAYIFPGASGSGKTSIVRFSPGMAILNDEISVVQLSGDGSPATAWGTPFYGDWGQPGEHLSAPVKGFFFPIKSKSHRILPLSQEETHGYLLPRICTYTTWEPRLRKLFDLGMQLAEKVPGYLLHFLPTPDFWDAIDDN